MNSDEIFKANLSEAEVPVFSRYIYYVQVDSESFSNNLASTCQVQAKNWLEVVNFVVKRSTEIKSEV